MRSRTAWTAAAALVMALLAAWLLAGCGSGTAVTGTGGAGTGTGAGSGSSVNTGEALFQIVGPDGTARPVSFDELKQLPSLQLEMAGSEEGPKLSDVLRQAGIAGYSQVIITGASGNIVLTKDQINDQVILDYTNRGTMKLASPDIPKDQWVKDITSIEVK